MGRLAAAAAILLSTVLNAQDLHVSGKRIRAHVQYLSSDEMAGRGVGTAGEKLVGGLENSLAADAEVAGAGGRQDLS